MKAVQITILGKPRLLAFTGEAMFQIRDQFGGVKELLEVVGPDTRESFSALCAASAILLEQAELARRNMGYEPEPIVGADMLMSTLAPSELVSLKTALPCAIELGYGREVNPENNEVDLSLAELNQKKTT